MPRHKYRRIIRTDIFPKIPREPNSQEIKEIKKHMTRSLNEMYFCVKMLGENCGIESVLYRNLSGIIKKIELVKEELKDEL